MYAAHFAAGLAIRGGAPKAPAWALLTAAFLPDLLWIGLSRLGVEPATDKLFFDDWSHSALSILLEATVFALLFWRMGVAVAGAVWIAGCTHLLLDLPIHPQMLALYPHAAVHLGWPLWTWGAVKGALGFTHYWWVQLATVVVLLAAYLLGARRANIPPNLALASCVSILGLHLLF